MLSTEDSTSIPSGLETAQAYSQPLDRIPRTTLRSTTIPNVEKSYIKAVKGPNSRYRFEGNAIVLLKPIYERELKTIWRYFSIHHWTYRASLGIYVFFDISDALVESICKILVKECRGLKKFRFYADRCKLVTNEGLKKLGHFISCRLGNLTYLSLQFILLQKVSNHGLMYLGSQIYAYSRNLRTLQLGFNCFANVNDKGIGWLGSKLKFLESLESLSLSFWKLPKITNIGCGMLASQIARDMVNLKKLSLDFSGCEEINDLGMSKLFGDKLSDSIANLKQLSIAFGNCLKITNTGLNLLVSDIVTNFTNLSGLEINFRGSRKITDQGIANAGSKIARNLSRLILLKLDFQKCDFANSQSLESIAVEIVDHLKYLQQLDLNFAE